MRLLQPLLLTVACVSAVTAGELDSAARKVLVDHLQQSSSEFRESIKGLTPAQWNYKPSPEVWSVAECAEHIALTEDFLRDMIEHKILTSPASADRIAERKTRDGAVLKVITDRSFKAKAPEPISPKRQFGSPDEALRKFDASRKKTLALAKGRDDLREHAAPHPVPVLKELDAYQWLLYTSGHTMRHTAQIREVKASPGFPTGT